MGQTIQPPTAAGFTGDGGSITLASDSNIRAGYDALFGKFFSAGIGQKIGIFMAAIAVILFILLVIALIQKARGSQSQYVTRTVGSGTAIAGICGLIFLLVAFQFAIPLLCSFADTALTALKPIFQNFFG